MLKHLAVPVVLAASLAGLTRPAQAQENKCHIVCAPAFVAQPGIVVTDAFNRPVLDGAGDQPTAAEHFLLRFTTVLPTAIPRVALVALVQWFPDNKTVVNPATGAEFNANSPAFVYGPVISLFDAGPLNFSVDALGVYGRNAASASSDYHTTFNVEGIAGLSIGHMMKMMGSDPPAYLRGVAIDALYDQQLTDRAPDFNRNKKLTPALLFLLTLPVAPMP